ncbi:hypothetical protein BGW80DRAFT_1442980 [Lactifluus volemus]|nr:hypothetical protein BGW80DRAFT_1442980 [Lactifluus volemus]
MSLFRKGLELEEEPEAAACIAWRVKAAETRLGYGGGALAFEDDLRLRSGEGSIVGQEQTQDRRLKLAAASQTDLGLWVGPVEVHDYRERGTVAKTRTRWEGGLEAAAVAEDWRLALSDAASRGYRRCPFRGGSRRRVPGKAGKKNRAANKSCLQPRLEYGDIAGDGWPRCLLRSTPSDLDIFNDLAHLALLHTPFEDHTLPDQPLNLIPLLSECGQTAPVEFSAFIEAFPVDPVVRSSCSGKAAFQKIGDVVLKIAIRNEECPDNIEAETPAPSDAKDVLNEIVVTYALGEMCDGFVNLLKTYVVRGKYPSVLLDLWDEYNRMKGSENVRPANGLTDRHDTLLIFMPIWAPVHEVKSFTTSSIYLCRSSTYRLDLLLL